MSTSAEEPPTPTMVDDFEHFSRGAGKAKKQEEGKQTQFRMVRSFRKQCMSEVYSPSARLCQSGRLMPDNQVKLVDVLNGRHLPPLTLRECTPAFLALGSPILIIPCSVSVEDYLVHVERAPENLWVPRLFVNCMSSPDCGPRYFVFWLRSYTEQYKAAEASQQNHTHSGKATISPTNSFSHSRSRTETEPPVSPTRSISQAGAHDSLDRRRDFALRVFFALGHPISSGASTESLELNLTEEVMARTRTEASASLDPAAFRAARQEAMDMLEESMRKWLVLSAGNADGNRYVALAPSCGSRRAHILLRVLG